MEPGAEVEYWSASLNKWIPARVLRRPQPGVLDLDCKVGVDACRVRLPELPRPASAAAGPPRAANEPPGAAGAGPLGLQAGEYCFYRSSSHGWIPAQSVKFRPEDGTYDLNVKQQVRPENISRVSAGTLVEYQSTSTNSWIRASVLRAAQEPGTFDLDCKVGVHICRMRPLCEGAGAGDLGFGQAPGPSPYRGWGPGPEEAPDAGRAPARGLPTSKKLDQLRQALKRQDPAALRQRLESTSALKLVGEELDRAGHMLWALEARPAALQDLRRAMERCRLPELQAALEAAAVAGVPDQELEAAVELVDDLGAPVWRYCPPDGKHLDIRAAAEVNGRRTQHKLNHGDVFRVSEKARGADGILYLRLADGRGWVFQSKPGVGTLCERHE